jgi:NCS1 family nucleobase:cation symporter-1
MSLTTIVSGFRQQTSLSRAGRVMFVTSMVTLACVIALLSEPAFLKSFTHFLLFLLAFFVPWSAISLTDFYLITHGKVDIPALSQPDGRYGRWNGAGISVYFLGVLVQLPFIDNPLYHGSLTWIFAGNDISWIIGWIVTALLWLLACRWDRRGKLEASVCPAK